jgi:Alpha/beta hydrolase of unknown function (DUF900)
MEVWVTGCTGARGGRLRPALPGTPFAGPWRTVAPTLSLIPMTIPRYKRPRDPRQSQLLNGFDWSHGIHPDAPAGSAGPGYFTSPKQYGDSSVIAFHWHNGLMDAKDSVFGSGLNHFFDRLEMTPFEEQAYIRRGKEIKQLRDLIKEGKDIVFLNTGIFNPDPDEAKDAVAAVAEFLSVGDDQLVVLPNDSAEAAFGGNPNTITSEDTALLINFALGQKVAPGNITLVAHSNGVPNLSHALGGVYNSVDKVQKGVVKFKEVVLFAPNTSNVKTLRNLTSHGEKSRIYCSSGDFALKFGASMKPEKIKLAVKDIPGAEVFSTGQGEHSVRAYITEIKAGRASEVK